MLDPRKLNIYKIAAADMPGAIAVNELEKIISQEMAKELSGSSLAGKKIGVLVGSRGIQNLEKIVRSVVAELKGRQATVVILPAMGSHGGGTATGQEELLAQYGITERTVGAPIYSTMKVVKIGDTGGHPVYVNSPALELDGIVPVNRVKAHTDYHGPHESGIVKMLAIGLGKKAQAELIHQHGANGLRELIPRVAEKILGKIPLVCAVAIVENSRDQTSAVEVLNRSNLFSREQELLSMAKAQLPKLPFAKLDVLVVKMMGKNISGVGIDPNVTGRMRINGSPDEDFAPSRIAALDLSAESQGNALGIGVADVITQKLYSKVDFEKTYVNVITSGFLERGFIPVIASCDEQAVAIAIQTCGRRVDYATVRIAFIENTLDLSEMCVSSALLPEAPPQYRIVAQVDEFFDNNGELLI